MSVPVSNNNVPSGGVPGGQDVGGPGGPREQVWWRADIRTFVMNLWVLIAVVLYSLQSTIYQMLLTPPGEWVTLISAEMGEGHMEVLFSNLFIFVVSFIGLILGTLSWWFTRYHLDELSVHRRSGIFFKKERTIRLESVQSVDISRPLVARLLGISELRFEVADGSGEALHIKYVSRVKATRLRRAALQSISILRAQGGARGTGVGAGYRPDAPLPSGAAYPVSSAQPGMSQSGSVPETAAYPRPAALPVPAGNFPESGSPEGVVAFRLSTGRLIMSILLENLVWVVPLVIVMGVSAIITAVFSGLSPLYIPMVALPSLGAPLIGYAGALWARFDNSARFRIYRGDRGALTLRYGFTGTHTQNVLPERVQAVQVEQSILWKMFGWYRVTMTIAGVGVDRSNQGGLTRNVALPVGNERETMTVLRLLLPELDEQQAQGLMAAARSSQKHQVPGAPQMLQVPSTARWLDPLTLHVKGLTSINADAQGARGPASSRPDANIEEHARGDLLLIRNGFLVRRLSVLPVRRVLGVRWTQGPFERACGCATLRFDVAKGPVRTSMKHLPPRTSLIIASTLTERLEGTCAYYRVPEAL
ncbi:PH domain-containing protein [Rothia mucilaginosa]|uniref:PH domain-containing protein n=1 Tax=Rothia mucilaginosa TaxID=43675 RepID=UPI00195C5B92|nr:PH domain-containing protein [Rothia mucilaginosa]VTY01804.1 Bacterial PH domain protein [Rothia mucilaginosa]